MCVFISPRSISGGGSDESDVEDGDAEDRLSSTSGEDLTQYNIAVAAAADDDGGDEGVRTGQEAVPLGAPVGDRNPQQAEEDQDDEDEEEIVEEEEIECEDGVGSGPQEEEEMFVVAAASAASLVPRTSAASSAPLRAAVLETDLLASSIEDLLMQSEASPMIPPPLPPPRPAPIAEAVRGPWPAVLPYVGDDDVGDDDGGDVDGGGQDRESASPGPETQLVEGPGDPDEDSVGEYSIEFDDAAAAVG